MKELICEAVSGATTLDDVRDCVVAVFQDVRNGNGVQEIGYVAGIITSDGREQVDRNIRTLAEHTERIRQVQQFPIFSATDVFSQKVFDRIDALNIPPEQWYIFWREILQSGHVTDIFMTPRWDQSSGARDEHETARSVGLRVHYIE